MKISTKGIYAIEAMLDLAMYSKNGVESLKNIAERRAMSDKYLEQIIGALRKSDLVSSVRGAGGGYQLARAPEEITVLEILQSVENNLLPMECLVDEAECENNINKCAMRSFWKRIWDEIHQITDKITLKDLMDESEKYIKNGSIEYFI
ncbi:BadM/Rrf2 family transcriptional regulator [Mobilisporobacter senegalensis]|uniref:BadM/Rrf2 family transcriptional regulator n=1 Tax=Mobilisporobacter senegalensis TaxID=1329262 RepID=A0A3N1XPH6_9FIRM|nr:Rrf2 family transcriptional regulator [Mobilisporobacter senegalensis]ROR28589.1 BadM/Rrf2 family transcriptional regulator [Mobilisporobacter senegalensis]